MISIKVAVHGEFSKSTDGRGVQRELVLTNFQSRYTVVEEVQEQREILLIG